MLRKGCKKKGSCFTDKIRKYFGQGRCSNLIAPLSKTANTGRVKVCKVTGDRRICARMASMGLYPGVEADVICSESGSQCLLKINGGTISLDSDVSDNIFVTSL
jgi:ferrous iron transport protein A